MPRKVSTDKSVQEFMEDLERYRKMILEWGADDAKIIPSDDVIIDMRVRAKCHYACEDFATNANCPPYVFDIPQVREMVDSFRYAIIFKLELPPELIAGDLTDEQIKERRKYALKRYEIIGRLELEAFDDGYGLALGFAGGPCSKYLCQGLECSAIKEGGTCRYPMLSRPSMEAMGMDVYSMATNVGWDIYPVGSHTSPNDIPHGVFVGIVFID